MPTPSASAVVTSRERAAKKAKTAKDNNMASVARPVTQVRKAPRGELQPLSNVSKEIGEKAKNWPFGAPWNQTTEYPIIYQWIYNLDTEICEHDDNEHAKNLQEWAKTNEGEEPKKIKSFAINPRIIRYRDGAQKNRAKSQYSNADNLECSTSIATHVEHMKQGAIIKAGLFVCLTDLAKGSAFDDVDQVLQSWIGIVHHLSPTQRRIIIFDPDHLSIMNEAKANAQAHNQQLGDQIPLHGLKRQQQEWLRKILGTRASGVEGMYRVGSENTGLVGDEEGHQEAVTSFNLCKMYLVSIKNAVIQNKPDLEQILTPPGDQPTSIQIPKL